MTTITKIERTLTFTLDFGNEKNNREGEHTAKIVLDKVKEFLNESSINLDFDINLNGKYLHSSNEDQNGVVVVVLKQSPFKTESGKIFIR